MGEHFVSTRVRYSSGVLTCARALRPTYNAPGAEGAAQGICNAREQGAALVYTNQSTVYQTARDLVSGALCIYLSD